MLDYIEENLCGEISLNDCARISGYSAGHFLHVFRETVGMTPTDYIRKRRLSEIAKEIMKGNQYLSETAFRYGFNSKENFTRAFKAEHHILPTEYRAAQNSLKLYERFCFETEDFALEPRIVELQPFSLTVYKCDEDFITDFWNRYNARGMSQKLSGGREVRDYGVSSWNCGKNRLDYYIGIRSEQAVGDTEDTVELRIAGGLYAVFSTPPARQSDFVNQIHRTWKYIKEQWFSQSVYERRNGYEFECYCEKSRLFSEDIYIPLKEKEKQEKEERKGT